MRDLKYGGLWDSIRSEIRIKYTVPLMPLRTLPVTGAYPYVKNSSFVTGNQALSGCQNCNRRADQGV